MSRDFDHVLLTRFSVRFTMDQPPPDENWLLYRWGFFRDALASSLANQTVRDFEWLVFFDASAPEWLRDAVSELSPGLFTPVWLDEPWGHGPIRSAVAGVTSRPYLITTRIDSDDAVARRFVEDLHARFDHQESMYVNFLRGGQVTRTGQVYRYFEPSGAFISYIERREQGLSPRTVFQSFHHPSSGRFAPILNVVGPPRWMQVIHGTNIANGVRGPRVLPAAVNREFTMDLPYTTHVALARFVAEWAVSVVRLWGFWIRRPLFAYEYLYALELRWKGTRVIPQGTRRSDRLVAALRARWAARGSRL